MFGVWCHDIKYNLEIILGVLLHFFSYIRYYLASQYIFLLEVKVSVNFFREKENW